MTIHGHNSCVTVCSTAAYSVHLLKVFTPVLQCLFRLVPNVRFVEPWTVEIPGDRMQVAQRSAKWPTLAAERAVQSVNIRSGPQYINETSSRCCCLLMLHSVSAFKHQYVRFLQKRFRNASIFSKSSFAGFVRYETFSILLNVFRGDSKISALFICDYHSRITPSIRVKKNSEVLSRLIFDN